MLVLDPAPNKLPLVLFCAPKAGLLAAPKMLPPVLALLPNPPNPVDAGAVVELLPPPKRPPALVVAVVLPKPVRLAPKDVVLLEPKPGAVVAA